MENKTSSECRYVLIIYPDQKEYVWVAPFFIGEEFYSFVFARLHMTFELDFLLTSY